MDAIRDEYLATSAREEGLSARKIVRHHQYCIESLARPAYRRLFWGPMWLVGEAPKRSHVAACQSFSRLAQVWERLQLRMPVEFRDLTDRPMPKSYSRWGDMRPRRIDSALGARKLLRAAIGLCGAVTSDLFVVLLGSTVRVRRPAFGPLSLVLSAAIRERARRVVSSGDSASLAIGIARLRRVSSGAVVGRSALCACTLPDAFPGLSPCRTIRFDASRRIGNLSPERASARMRTSHWVSVFCEQLERYCDASNAAARSHNSPFSCRSFASSA